MLCSHLTLELDEAGKRVLKILRLAGGRSSPSELERLYGSKYVYTVADKLVNVNLLEKTDESGSIVYALSKLGLEMADELLKLDEEFISRLTEHMSKRLKHVAPKYGFKGAYLKEFSRLYVEAGLYTGDLKLGKTLDLAEAVRKIWADREFEDRLVWFFARQALVGYRWGSGELQELSQFLVKTAFMPLTSDLAAYSKHPSRWRTKRYLVSIGVRLFGYAAFMGLILFLLLLAVIIYLTFFWRL